MPIYYVHEELITEQVIGEDKWPTGESYNRISIETAEGAVKKNADGEFEPLKRRLCIHNCGKNPGAKTRINSNVVETGRPPRVNIRTSGDTKHDSDVFVVALPYDGMIVPMKNQDLTALAIYKTMILKSDKFSIECADQRYKRVFYLVVRPHHEHLGNDGWYDSACDLKVTFAQSNKNQTSDPEKAKWTFRTVTVRFGANGKYELKTEEETAPYSAFDPDTIGGNKICELVEPMVLNNGANNNRGKVNNGTFQSKRK